MAVEIGSKVDEIYCNGLRAFQHKNIILCLDRMFEKIGPVTRIIEIGTYIGGFIELLRSHQISKNCKFIYTWDIRKIDGLSDWIVQINQDCFEAEDVIGRMIEKPGRTLIFCDGGDKKKEFATFAKYLKQGDIIFAHDYCVTQEEFERSFRGKIWNWLELIYEDIKETVYRYRLQPFMEQEFSSAVWAAFIR